jgi:hypothetical protein
MSRRAIVAALALVAACGCGYKTGYMARTDISRVSVGVFENRTFYRDIEAAMTRAVTDEIVKITPYRLSHSVESDAVLDGTIIAYGMNVLQEDLADNPTEAQVVITVEAVLRETSGGRVIARATVRESESYSAAAGETELSARATLMKRAARSLVEKTFEQQW